MGLFNLFRRQPRHIQRDCRDELLDQRVVVITGLIDENGSTETIAQLLYLQHKDPDEPIQLHIDSEGGSVVGGMAIIDAIDSLSPPVHTLGLNRANGIALFLLASGCRGSRSAIKKARFLIPSFPSMVYGKDTTEELIRIRGLLAEHLATRTGQTRQKVEQDLMDGRRFDAIGAREYGIIDRVIDFK
jgi:ATP-dependent Clp protease protease subunit